MHSDTIGTLISRKNSYKSEHGNDIDSPARAARTILRSRVEVSLSMSDEIERL